MKILVIGSTGQLGSELTLALRKKYGDQNVIAGINKTLPAEELKRGPYEFVDVSSRESLKNVIQKYQINVIYHLAAILSAVGEKNPELAWQVNILGLKNVLDVAVANKIERVFFPSSIAAFGPNTPKEKTPQYTAMDPNTMYGLTKLAGELLCQYYFKKYQLDVRSVRYPGLISYKTQPGGGTTDYAVAIFYEALKTKSYTCFVRQDTVLPMMYMPDAVRATLELMEAPSEKLTVRTSYNLSAISFSVKDLIKEIKKYLPDFCCECSPDHRQTIADSWPKSIDDSYARRDWGWRHEYDLAKMSEDMLKNLKNIL
ncbi:MAG: NAD-dependent epimerase/dehydratase family protein [Patescibacteria group bacterium]|nr:NAD-dependent epimerase/dehydratase family protein [Patescibacteria group bacterium]MDD5121240.1 NAD-dependent epimerase/dehydratase family protein [Patescibacteria group bacterium]MDD5222099.1 NAD-dependent epimerase/dehydratase family protein [Patescibacteria group bacterium]MDD5395841.1 NAD-dependent epimerase/dehydratase family protein [Patescibacteria group bacterium]